MTTEHRLRGGSTRQQTWRVALAWLETRVPRAFLPRWRALRPFA